MPNQPIINSDKNEDGNYIIDIVYDNRNDIKNYYSLDDGNTWNEYTDSFEISSGTILAKSLKSSELQSSNSLTTVYNPKYVKYGGYYWHVIREYVNNEGKYHTLLMDVGQLSYMNHCTKDNNPSTDCGYNGSYYVYSWDKSLIQTYLNNSFLQTLQSRGADTSKIKSEQVCVDPSIGGSSVYSYGGYRKEEINAVGGTCSEYQNYKIRLITASEYINLTYYYRNTQLPYEGIVQSGTSGKVSKLD